MLAHCLQNANYFRFRLSQLGNVKLVAQENQGPSVGFKIYNPEWVQDPDAEFAFELARSPDAAYKARLQRNTDYHRSLFTGRGKVGSTPTGWRPSLTPTMTPAASTPTLPGRRRCS